MAVIEAKYGTHKGLPIVDERGEFRGMDGGLNKGVRVQAIEFDDFDDKFIAGKVRPIGERFDFVVKGDNGEWRSYAPADEKPTGVIRVRIYKVLGGGFVDEETVSVGVHKIMEDYATAEALRKEGQQSMSMSQPEGGDATPKNVSPMRQRARGKTTKSE